MIVTLIDYSDTKSEHDIGNLEDIYMANMEVISGDEVLNVTYKDGKLKYFDSCSTTRIMNAYDDSYNVYMPGVRNLFEDETWLNRKDSYDDKWRDD